MHVLGQETGHNHASENSRWCGVYPSIVAVSQTKQTVDLNHTFYCKCPGVAKAV